MRALRSLAGSALVTTYARTGSESRKAATAPSSRGLSANCFLSALNWLLASLQKLCATAGH